MTVSVMEVPEPAEAMDVEDTSVAHVAVVAITKAAGSAATFGITEPVTTTDCALASGTAGGLSAVIEATWRRVIAQTHNENTHENKHPGT